MLTLDGWTAPGCSIQSLVHFLSYHWATGPLTHVSLPQRVGGVNELNGDRWKSPNYGLQGNQLFDTNMRTMDFF